MPKMKMTDLAVQRIKPPKTGKQVDVWDASLPGFGFRHTWTGRKTWQAMVRDRGAQRRMKLGTYPAMSLADARREAHTIMGRVEKGEDPIEKKAKVLTVADAAAEYFEIACPQHRKGWETRRIIEREVLPKWKRRNLSDLDKTDIRDLIVAKHRAGYPSAAHRLFRITKTFLLWCEGEGFIGLSPVGNYKPPEPLKIRKRVLTDDELVAVWRAAAHEGHPYGPIVRLLILCGQRRGEVGGMRWADLDIDGGVWTLPADQNKSDREHVVPLSGPMLAILRDLPRLSDTYVFPSPRGDRPISGFGRAKERFDALTDIEPWRVHDIRRTVSTGMRKLGVDRSTVGEVLNHARQGVTGTVYDQYDSLPEMKTALERWADRVIEITTPPATNVVRLRSA